MSKHKWLAASGILAAIATAATGMGAAPVNLGPPDNWQAQPPHREFFVAPEGRQISGSTTYYSPSQIRHAYGFDQLANNGNGQTIAIVDAYDDPNAWTDLQTFDSNFGIPDPPSFQKIYATSKPRTNSGWALEISLDVQWAHAIAPKANIILVEAASSSLSNLLKAVDVAASKANVVSMSWGGNEFSGESSYDNHFNKTGVTFVAASGDSGSGVIWPAISPYVLSVGGTTLPLDLAGNIQTGKTETGWSGSGGGPSAYESEPGYQTSYRIAGGKRTNPDVAYDADPNTGFLVYDSVPYYGQSGWWSVGGTSAGSPQWAALIALANQGRTSPLSSNNLSSSPEYSAATGTAYASDYTDITSGSNGAYSANTGYDLVTGVGSPQANNLVPYLVAH